MDGILKLLVKGYGHMEDPKVRERAGSAAGAVGICTNLLLFAVKLVAGLLSHSLGVLADAVNNLTDSGSSIIMLVGFRLAGKPADEKHPFGHARLEYLCGVTVSFIVLFLGLQLGISSVGKIREPEEAQFSWLTLGILVFSILVKLWQCLFYRTVGKKLGSEALLATGEDSRNDVLSTGVVLLGAAITRLTGYNLDGFLGLCVAVFIAVSGVRLILETGGPLLGTAPDPGLVRSICQRILSYKGVIGLHDLTVHSYGAGQCFASVHCEVPAETDILVSHDVIDNIERDFLEQENIHLVIHLDPVVIGDARTDALKAQVRESVAQACPEASIHDFRVVWGVTHSNVVFDAAVPFSLKKTDSELQALLARQVESLGAEYRAVVNIDRASVPLEEGG